MRRAVIMLAIAVSASACTQYARVARSNAPGVIDISTPPAHENGTDELYELPAPPKAGADAYIAWLHPAFGGGLVRHGAGFELSFGVSIEKDSGSSAGDGVPITNTAWGVSLGMGLVQFRDPPGPEKQVTEAPGPLSLELYYRKLLVIVAAGPLVYPDTRDIGAQITIHAPISQLRFRYAQNSGFEVMLAYDFNFPLMFAWSR